MTALTIAGEPVKVLTTRQPWAWAMAHGGKDTENRATLWRYRGWLLNHAGAGWSERGETDRRLVDAWWDVAEDVGVPAAARTRRHQPNRLVDIAAWPEDIMRDSRLHAGLRSHVLSLSRLVDAHRIGTGCGDDCAGSVWPEAEYIHADGRTIHDVVHLTLHDTVALPEPIPYPFGGLGLRDPRPELVEEVRRQLDLAA